MVFVPDGNALPTKQTLTDSDIRVYFVRVSKPGYKVEQRSITIKEGVTNTFNFNLKNWRDLVLITPKMLQYTLMKYLPLFKMEE